MSTASQETGLKPAGKAADQKSGGKPGSASKSCAKKTWIKIQLVGEDDEPIPGEKYKIVLPDGTVKQGSLDIEGSAGFEGLDEGQCEITFPDLDKDAWEPD